MSDKIRMHKKTASDTDFGFRRVAADKKASLVREVFDNVAPRYDIMNDLMSGGIHRLWKSCFLDCLNPPAVENLLDVAGGTGDIASGYLKRRKKTGRPGHAVVCDINHNMLAEGRKRQLDKGFFQELDWCCADAEKLPFDDDSFDAYTIAFGLRNVTDKAKALAEAARVVRPGGQFLCLEFSHVVLPVFDKLYDSYSFNVIPFIGEKVTGHREAYQYLVESIRTFPKQGEMAQMMEQAGLARVKYQNLTGGVAAIHTGRVV